MKTKTGYVILDINYLLFVVLLIMFLAGYLKKFLLTFASMLLHEMGHVAAAVLLGKKVSAVKLLPVGLSACMQENTCSRWENIIIYSGGPSVNILLSMSAYIMNAYGLFDSDAGHFFMLLNIYLALFNMIPLLPLDGGKILREVMALRLGLLLANSYVVKASAVLSLLLALLGAIQMFNSPHNFSLFVIGLYIFFYLDSEKEEVALMNIKHIIYRRSRILKKGVYGARDLVVVKSMHLGDALKSMDFDRFHFIHILDDDLKLIKVITEQELIDAMLKYNADMTFEELIRAGSLDS